eukprot:TRINITY_DN2877_c0_g1_i2.p2 TRINITY_DN2877_c0_g1~~TRINITY_DN2877_c0_g1_i2.p2  ORF type:complete len:220 (-),score=26.38 TRINITY_DN2877_c0_g1_i2:818-1477(-)
MPTNISVLMPAFSLDSYFDITSWCREYFGFYEQASFEIFKMIPYDAKEMDDSGITEIAIKLKRSDFSLKTIESLLSENQRLSIQLERSKEALRNIASEYTKITTLSDEIKIENSEAVNMKLRKFKDIEDENRKLRQIIKTQLENSEKLRMETQATIETLKEEFDLLVKELSIYQKKESLEMQGHEGTIYHPLPISALPGFKGRDDIAEMHKDQVLEESK